MTIGARTSLLRLLSSLMLVLIMVLIMALMMALIVKPLQAAESDIEAVFKQLASQPRHDIRYTEKKYSGFLDDAQILNGILRYLPPDTIVREQLSPAKLRFEISGNVVKMQRKGETRVIKLDTMPTLQVFINSFRAILYGDLASLKSYYKIEFSGNVSSWSITLQPRDTMLGAVLETIKFDGTLGSINKIEIRENEEDWSEMKLEPIKDTSDHGKK